jgi:hypothetical protein
MVSMTVRISSPVRFSPSVSLLRAPLISILGS